MGKVIKQSMLLLLLMAVATTSTGCLFHRENLDEELEKYMEDRYGEDFTPIGGYGGGLLDNVESNFLYSCESLPGHEISVTYWDLEEGAEIYDNYYAHYYHEDVIRYFEDLATDIFGEAKVFYAIPYSHLPKELGVDCDFETFLGNNSLKVIPNVFVSNTTNWEENVNELITHCQENHVNADIRLCAGDATIIDEITSANFQDYTGGDWYDYRVSVAIDTDGNIIKEDWRVNNK